jgi:hypothetical protein
LNQKVVVEIRKQPLIAQNPQGHRAAMAAVKPGESAV